MVCPNQSIGPVQQRSWVVSEWMKEYIVNSLKDEVDRNLGKSELGQLVNRALRDSYEANSQGCQLDKGEHSGSSTHNGSLTISSKHGTQKEVREIYVLSFDRLTQIY
jgi:hypothetical protein